MENHLERNLIFLPRYNQTLTDKIMDIKELKHEFYVDNAKSGDAILCIDNVPLNSTDDPYMEAAEIFQQLPSNESENTYIICGFELGYLFNHFIQNCKGNIIVFEPNVEILRVAFELVNYSAALRKENVFITSTNEELNFAVEAVFNRKQRICISYIESYGKLYKDMIKILQEEAEALCMEPYTGGPLKLNIGAGKWGKAGWRTLDCYRDADFFVDLREMDRLEIEDNCIEKAFCSHCIEHIEDEHIEKLLKELYRCTKPGGIVRFSCPDADKAIAAYKNNDLTWFDWVKTSHIGAMLVNVFVSYTFDEGGPNVSEELVREKINTLSKEDFIKWCVSLKDETKPYIAHTNGHYFEKLKDMFGNAGFKNIKRSEYMCSDDEEFRNDLFDKHEKISIFVECYK